MFQSLQLACVRGAGRGAVWEEGERERAVMGALLMEPMCKTCINSELFIQLFNSFSYVVCIHSVTSPLDTSILPTLAVPEAGVIRCYRINGFAQEALSCQ